MKVVAYLEKCRKNKLDPFEQLNKKFAIKTNFHPEEPLVILNYCQIDSPKTAPIAQECRGLVLHTETFEVIARPFRRFFNWGETRHYVKQFDWDTLEAQSKEDGSLIIMYHWNGSWHANTRNSFGGGNVGFTDHTFSGLFFSAIDKNGLCGFVPGWTWCFELVSPYNKIVRQYPEPKAILLAGFNNQTGEEASRRTIESAAARLGTVPVQSYPMQTIEEIQTFLHEQEEKDPTFEGFVIKDANSNRWKIKSETYVALHHMRGNDNVFNPKHLLPFILRGESDEVLTYFPEAKEPHDRLMVFCNNNLFELNCLYAKYKGIEDQKEFALAVKDHPFSGMLFRARKTGESIDDIWRDSADMILKVYK